MENKNQFEDEKKEVSRIEEDYTGHKLIPIKLANKVLTSICKIKIDKNKKKFGTGFFMSISDNLKFMITNFHVINPTIDEKIEIQIYNEKTWTLNKKNRIIKYLGRPKDITAIEIKENDDIYKDIEFLDYDPLYEKKGYEIYQSVDVFSPQFPLGKDASFGSGTIFNINGPYFDHDISTDKGSSGSPIILLNGNINVILVIGIHKDADIKQRINGGTFIGEIINEINGKRNDLPINKRKIIKPNPKVKIDNFQKSIKKSPISNRITTTKKDITSNTNVTTEEKFSFIEKVNQKCEKELENLDKNIKDKSKEQADSMVKDLISDLEKALINNPHKNFIIRKIMAEIGFACAQTNSKNYNITDV